MKIFQYVYLAIFCCLLTSVAFEAQAQYVMTDALVYDCEGTLSDSEEGPDNGQYDHDEDFIFTICVEGASTITAIFDFFAKFAVQKTETSL